MASVGAAQPQARTSTAPGDGRGGGGAAGAQYSSNKIILDLLVFVKVRHVGPVA